MTDDTWRGRLGFCLDDGRDCGADSGTRELEHYALTREGPSAELLATLQVVHSTAAERGDAGWELAVLEGRQVSPTNDALVWRGVQQLVTARLDALVAAGAGVCGDVPEGAARIAREFRANQMSLLRALRRRAKEKLGATEPDVQPDAESAGPLTRSRKRALVEE